MQDNFLVCVLTVLFIAFIFLFFALVAIDLIEERLKGECDDKPEGEDKNDDDDITSHLYYEPWMYDDDFWK